MAKMFGPQILKAWAVYLHAAYVLTIRGLDDPIYFSLYGDGWWSFLTMGNAALEETGQEIGLLHKSI